MGFRLTVTKGKSEGKEFSFAKTRVRVGRDHDNDLVLYDLNVSRNHFEIVVVNGAHLLRDCGSQNGTRLNGNAAVEAKLIPGDRIQLGALEFEFQGSDTQPSFTRETPTKDGPERAELFAPQNKEQRMKLEELRTHAVGSKDLEGVRALKAAAAPEVKTPEPTPVTKRKKNTMPMWKRVAYPVAAVALMAGVIALVVHLYTPKTQDFSAKKFTLDGTLESKSYGAGRVDVATAAQAQFVWLSNGGRSIVTYTPGGIEHAGELTIELNGVEIGQAPETGPPWGSPVELKLDRKRLRKDEENTLVFRHHAEAGEAPRWGIRDITLNETVLPEPSRERAAQALKLADDALAHKRVALGNLSLAADNYRKAMLLLEGYDEPGPLHERAEAAMRATDKELDVIIQDRLFAAAKAKKLGRADEADVILRELLLYVPRGDDPRRKEVEERLATPK